MNKNLIHIYPTYVEKIFVKGDPKNHFLAENDTLNLLKNKFINNPFINHHPFPTIISSNKENLSMKMTFCGLDLGTYRRTRRKYRKQKRKTNFEPINEEYLIDTINCIVNNLKNLFIAYHDIHARNFCINSNGQLHLIDFETAIRKPEDYKKRKPGQAAYCLERIEKYKDEFKELICNYIT